MNNKSMNAKSLLVSLLEILSPNSHGESKGGAFLQPDMDHALKAACLDTVGHMHFDFCSCSTKTYCIMLLGHDAGFVFLMYCDRTQMATQGR